MPIRPTTPEEVPPVVPVFPLSGALLLPNTHRPLNIFEPRYVDMVDAALAGDRLIGLIQPVDDKEESPAGRPPLLGVGCLGRITQFEEQDDGRYFIVLEGVTRFDVVRELPATEPYRLCEIATERYASDFEPDYGEEDIDRERFLSRMHDYAEFADLDVDWSEVDRISTADLVNFCCMVTPYGAQEKQALLEARSLHERAETLIALTEVEMARAGSGVPLQ